MIPKTGFYQSFILVLLLLLLVGLGILLLPAPWWWIGSGLTAASLWRLFVILQLKSISTESAGHRSCSIFGKTIPIGSLLLEIGLVLIVLALATIALHRAAMGERPVSGDHNVHFLRFSYFMNQMLAHGKLFGWSNMWFAGHPVGYLYPFGAYLWGALVYGLGFGILSFAQAYGVAVWLAYCFEGAAVYAFGRYAFGRIAGVIAGILYLLDLGTKRYAGGWLFSHKLGVWPNTFSVALSTLALVALLHVLRRGSWRAVGSFALLAAASALVHPIQLINLSIIVAGGFAAVSLLEMDEHWKDRLIKFAAALGLTALIAALWYLPYITSTEFTYSYGRPWSDLNKMARLLQDAELVEGMWTFSSVLGFFGILLCLTSRKAPVFLTGSLVLVFLFLGSNEGSDIVAALVSRELADKIEYRRFAVLFRPYWFAACGFALYSMFAFVKQECCEHDSACREKQSSFFRQSALFICTAAAVTLATPFAWPFLRGISSDFVNRKILYEADRKSTKQRQQMVEWINSIAAQDKRFFRVAFFDKKFDVSHVDLGLSLDVPFLKIGWTPAAGTRFHFANLDMEIIKLLGVRYVISPPVQYLTLSDMNRNTADWLFRAGKIFPPLMISEFIQWTPKRFRILDGAGDIQVEKFEDEEIVLTAGPQSKGRLVLAVSYFDRWKAALNEQPVEISTSEIGTKNESAFITVDLHPGKYRFTFQRQWPEKVGFILFIIGVILSLILLLPFKKNRKLRAVE